MIPDRAEVEYFLDEIMRDSTTQRDTLSRIGLLYGIGWQTARRWLLVLNIALPFAAGPRGPYKDKQ